LEVTGIPELSADREFPWPKPSFVEASRRHLFEVSHVYTSRYLPSSFRIATDSFCFQLSLFENNNCEYIFPEGLYVGRLQALEASIRERGMKFQGLGVHLYYSEAQGGSQEETEMKEYDATIESLEEDEGHPDPHLGGSGYGIIKADCESFMDTWSPWEIVIDGSTSERPSLTEEGKKFVLDHLNQVLRKPNVHDYFSMPVDETRYSDYKTMVEVEMNIMFMKRRLQSNYYGSKLSVISDLRLIRDNCIKYNTTQNDLSVVACEIVEAFEAAVLTSEERSVLITEEEFNKFVQEPQHSTVIQQAATTQGSNTNRPNNHSTTQTYNLRHRANSRPQSSLESLPRPRSTRQAAIRNDAAQRGRLTRSRDRHSGAEDVLGRITRSGAGRRTNADEQASESENEDENPPNPAGAANEAEDDEVDNDLATSENQPDEEHSPQNSAASSPRNRRSSRRNASRAASSPGSFQDDHDDDEESVDNVLPQPRASRRTTRNGTVRTRSRNGTYSDGSGEESHRNGHSSDEKSARDDDEAPVSRTRISIRSRTNTTTQPQQSVRSSPRASRRTVAQRQPESPTRRSRRAAVSSHKSYEEASDYESPDESSDGSEPIEPPPRKRSRKQPTYTELPSDFEEEEGVSEGEDEEDEPPQARASRKRRNGKCRICVLDLAVDISLTIAQSHHRRAAIRRDPARPWIFRNFLSGLILK
jgi:hypothetical protein